MNPKPIIHPGNYLKNSWRIQQGFSLIELLVVVSLIVILMLGVVALFLSSIVTGSKINLEQKVKSEGNYTLNQISTLIKNAQRITSTCNPEGISNDHLDLINYDGGQTVIEKIDQGDQFRIASYSSFLDTNHRVDLNDYYYLTSNYDRNQNPNPLTFVCFSNPANNNYYVEVNLTLRKGYSSTSSKNTVIENFSTGVTVRGQ